MAEAPKLSFTFSKQKKSIKLVTPLEVANEAQTKKESLREYVTSIEDNIIQSEKEPEKPLVIPLIQSRNGLRQKMKSKAISNGIHPTDELTQQALRELKQEALEFSEGVDPFTHSAGLTIPLTETDQDDKVDDVNYDAVPVEKFGLAVLAGMGLDPSELKKNSAETIGPVRPKGLGLGADPRAVQAVKASSEQTTKEQLLWKVGAKCQAVLGKYEGKYGMINGLDGDTGRVIVKFTISKEIAPVLQHMIRLVSEKEYAQYANCINQDEVNRYKAEEAKLQKQPSQQSQSQPQYQASSTHSNNSQINGSARRASETITKHSQSYSSSSSSSSGRIKDRGTWVRPNLVVKLLDKRYANGKYYKSKLTVIEVTEGQWCQCRTESGRVLDGIHSKYLQTVVPHSNNVKVMIVDGPRSGEMARLMDQNYERNEVDLRTRAGTMIQLTYDQICAVSDVL